MVVERYLHGPGQVYARAAEHGRLLPDGLRCIDSWVVDDQPVARCFQLMETDDATLFTVWFDRWKDLVAFELWPVVSSYEAASRVGSDPPSRC